MKSRPSTYKQWRAIYNRNLRDIGFHVAWLAQHAEYTIHIDRQLCRLLQRQRRLQARMDIEQEVGDATYLDALADFVEKLVRD